MENIYTVAKPWCFLAKFLGVFPLTFESSSHQFIVKWQNLVYSFLMLLLPFALIFRSLGYINFTESWLMDIWKLHAILGVSLIVLVTFYQVDKRWEISKFFQAVDAFDQQVGNIFKLRGLWKMRSKAA